MPETQDPEMQDPAEFSFMVVVVVVSPRRLLPPRFPFFPAGSWGGGGAIAIILATAEDEEMDAMAVEAPPAAAPPEVADAMSTSSSKMSLKLGKELVVSRKEASSMHWPLVVVGGGMIPPCTCSLEGCDFLEG